MSEEDVRGGLLDAVADEPPLHFDPDELIASARRQVRRRALVAAGVATVAVMAVAVAVPIALSPGSGGTTTPVADRPTKSAPSPTAAPWPPSGVDPRHFTPDELRHRGTEMSEHLRGALPTTLPSASDFTFGEFGGEASGDFYEGQTSINAAFSFTIDGGRYSIVITSWAQGTAGSPAATCVANCHRLDDQADGGVAYEQSEELDEGFIETIYHYRDNGAMVSVAAYNYDMAGKTPPTYLPSIPMTRDQLVTLATDPELEL